MDPIEDFQFKPLTEGLGFHKKTGVKTNTQTTSSNQLMVEQSSHSSLSKNNTQSFSIKNESIQEPLKSASLNLTSPLPRKAFTTEADNKSKVIDDVLNELNTKRQLNFKDTSVAPTKNKTTDKVSAKYSPSLNQTKEEAQTKLTNCAPTVGAYFLDFLLVLATQLLCMIILLMVTKVDLVANLSNPDSEFMIYISMASLMTGVIWMYLTTSRIFMGYTPGEWVFDQTLEKPQQMGHVSYALKVAARSAIVIATGIITLPLISLLFQKDLTGQLVGLNLRKKQM